MESLHDIAGEDEKQRGRLVSIELRIKRLYLEEAIQLDGNPNRVDPDKWRPLMMSFQKFYGLGSQVHPSVLSSIPEHLYAGPDLERARK